MILKINSSNPNFLSIINKNPDSDFGLYLKNIKNGTLIGHCISQNDYHVIFQDGNELDDKEHSFNMDKSNQIDFFSYCNPQVYLNVMNHLFQDLLKDKAVIKDKQLAWLDNKTIGELDKTIYNTTITIPSIYIDSKWATKKGEFLLAKYLPIVNFKHLIGNIYSFDIQTNSILDAINLTAFITLMISVSNEQYYDVSSDEILAKYIRIMKNVGNIPYFIIYLFKRRLLTNRDKFYLFRKDLEECTDKLSLSYGDTHTQRIDAIVSKLNFNYNIVDFGCGELRYARVIMKDKLKKGRKYFAVDSDDRYREYANNIKNRYAAELIFSNDFPPEDVLNEPFQVICSEVIEHIGILESKDMILNMMKNKNCKRIIITTPNKDFNKFYKMEDDEVRRADHKEELTKKKFHVFMRLIKLNNLYIEKDFSFTMSHIGDIYHGIKPTLGLIITRKK